MNSLRFEPSATALACRVVDRGPTGFYAAQPVPANLLRIQHTPRTYINVSPDGATLRLVGPGVDETYPVPVEHRHNPYGAICGVLLEMHQRIKELEQKVVGQ